MRICDRTIHEIGYHYLFYGPLGGNSGYDYSLFNDFNQMAQEYIDPGGALRFKLVVLQYSVVSIYMRIPCVPVSCYLVEKQIIEQFFEELDCDFLMAIEIIPSPKVNLFQKIISNLPSIDRFLR